MVCDINVSICFCMLKYFAGVNLFLFIWPMCHLELFFLRDNYNMLLIPQFELFFL